MSIGQHLEQARRRVGLTVAQVSQQTHIRETIISGIEHDDYTACGGDFYARGHIRAIAQAVSTDAGPLVAEYDTAHQTTRSVMVAEPSRATESLLIRRLAPLRWPTVVLGLVLLITLGVALYVVL